MVTGENEGGHYFWCFATSFGQIGVCGLPVVAGTNKGGHYFWYCNTRSILKFQLSWKSEKPQLARWTTKWHYYQNSYPPNHPPGGIYSSRKIAFLLVPSGHYFPRIEIQWLLGVAYKHLYFYLKVGISLSLISKQFETDFGHLSRAVSICHEPRKKIWEFFELVCGGAIHFCINKGMSQKIHRKICHRTIFALIWGKMVKLTYRIHQISTFSLAFPKTPMMAIFYAKMAICQYGHLTP